MVRERLLWIDVVRTLAIFLIVLFHFIYEINPDQSLRWIGYVGVSLFFIASGYVLAKNYPDLENLNLSWLKKRYVRIVSLYYPTLIAIVLLFSTQTWYRGIHDLILHFIFLNFVSHDTLYSIISPAWFLIPLMGFYLLFPYLNRLLKWSKYILIIAFLLMIADRILIEKGWISYSPLSFLGDFCFGIAFVQDRKNLALAASVLTVIASPLMAIPYFIFYLMSSIEHWNADPFGIFSTISKYTLEIFLFHESIMMVLLRKWSIYSLDIFSSLAVLIITLSIVEKISILVQQWLLPKIDG